MVKHILSLEKIRVRFPPLATSFVVRENHFVGCAKCSVLVSSVGAILCPILSHCYSDHAVCYCL
jgi:hypothetical protein